MKQSIIIRLDDAAERMDIERWDKMEKILDKYAIKPLVGIIPDCRDPKMRVYEKNLLFWDKAHQWIDKGWTIALHGYQHVYDSKDGGINPVNKKSEFAGHSYEIQAAKIKSGLEIFKKHTIYPDVFFAPSHTFDSVTLEALRNESKIRCISDTIARDAYYKSGFTYVPVQSGVMRRLPFQTVTYCVHPNMLNDYLLDRIDDFFSRNTDKFVCIRSLMNTRRKYDMIDNIISELYFARRRSLTLVR